MPNTQKEKVIKFIYGSLEKWNDLCAIKEQYPKTYNWLISTIFLAGILAGLYIALLIYLLK